MASLPAQNVRKVTLDATVNCKFVQKDLVVSFL